MRDHLNQRQPADLADPHGRAMNVVGQLEQILRSIADVHTVNAAHIHARQGLDLIATLDRLNAADPDVPAQRYPSESVDHAFELDNELLRAETGAPWNGGI